MKAEDNHILNILYSPVAYAHSDQVSEISHMINILDDVLLNHWIINQYQLENLPDTWQPDDTISLLILSHWYVIPTIAYLIGGYLLREQLLVKRINLIIDPQLSAFISLPLRHAISPRGHNVDCLAWGVAFISGLVKNLPVALQQRLRLCFPSDIIMPNIYIAKTADHINLLRMAINYAYNFQK